VRICGDQLLAHRAKNEEILDPSAICLTVQALEASGVLDFALDNWLLKDDATKINKEDSERSHKLTAKTGDYHGANGADGNQSLSTPPPNPAPTGGNVVLPYGVMMYYCWSHGLGKNKQHISLTCTFKKDGHVDMATADNMQGAATRSDTAPPAHPQAVRLLDPDGEGSRRRYLQLVKQCSMNCVINLFVNKFLILV
jgi:hypothetical protein